MQTKQLLVRSAVTVVATGLTLLSNTTSQASGPGSSRMRLGGNQGGMNRGAIHQGISNRAMTRGRGTNNVIGQNRTENRTITRSRDDRGGHGERERGDDKGRNASITRGEREPGDDHGRHRERGDDKGGNRQTSINPNREVEPGDDHGRRHREPGDDHGGR